MYETNIDANPLSNMFEKLVLRELVELVAMLPVHVERMQLTWSYLMVKGFSWHTQQGAV